jgi:branched-chain amino acid transport system permease protein
LGAVVVINGGGHPGWGIVVAIFVIAMVACALAGVVIERFAYRPLRHQPRLAVLITAIGVSMLLEYGGQAVFSPDPRSFPALIPDIALINTSNFRLSLVQVVIVAVAILLMIGLQFIIMRTKIGSAMRAVSQDQTAAVLMGINTNAVIAFTFAIGSALAGAGGVLNSIYTPKIDPLMGLLIGIKAFVAAVLGGIGSVPGAVLGGLLMGFAETGVVAVGKSEYRDAIAFAILIIVLLLRPAGILGKSTAEKV